MRKGHRGAKRQPFGQSHRVGRRAFDRREPPVPGVHTVEPRRRVEQRPRIGVTRVGQERFGRTLLDHFAAVHHDDATAYVGDDAEVVADQDDRGAEIGVELAQEIEDLRLDRDVQRRRRLVGNSSMGSLENPSRASRAGACRPRTDAGIRRSPARAPIFPSPKELDRPSQRRRTIVPAVNDHRLDELVRNALDRIERCHRVLEDHRDRAAAKRAHFGLAHLHDVAIPELDLSARDAALLLQQPDDRERRDALAGP